MTRLLLNVRKNLQVPAGHGHCVSAASYHPQSLPQMEGAGQPECSMDVQPGSKCVGQALLFGKEDAAAAGDGACAAAFASVVPRTRPGLTALSTLATT